MKQISVKCLFKVIPLYNTFIINTKHATHRGCEYANVINNMELTALTVGIAKRIIIESCKPSMQYHSL